jgi:hypothetical protein
MSARFTRISRMSARRHDRAIAAAPRDEQTVRPFLSGGVGGDQEPVCGDPGGAGIADERPSFPGRRRS